MTGPRGEDLRTDEAVRRLLGAAADPPSVMPEHVAARLDDVLTDLVRERSSAGSRGPAPVAALAERRRPRRWPQVLVAAAAVSVIGLGLGNLVGPGGAGDSASTEGSTAAGGARDLESAEELLEDDSAPRDAPVAPEEAGERLPVPRLRTESLTVDVERVQHFAAPAPIPAPSQSRACVNPRTDPEDSWLPVLLDGSEAVLVLAPARDGWRSARVYGCDDAGTPMVTTRVEAP